MPQLTRDTFDLSSGRMGRMEIILSKAKLAPEVDSLRSTGLGRQPGLRGCPLHPRDPAQS